MRDVQDGAAPWDALPQVQADPVGRLIFVNDDPGVPDSALHDPLGGLNETTAAGVCTLLEAKQIGTALLSGNVLQRDIPLRSVPDRQRRQALSAGGNNAVRSMERIRVRGESALRPVLDGLALGNITLVQAQEQSAPILRDLYERVRDVGRRASGLARLGGDPTVYREEEVWFRSAVREEVGYWNTFLAEVEAGRVEPARMERRFSSYLDALRFMYEAARVSSLPDDVLLYWAGPEDEKRCPGCVYMQARSPFTKDTIPAVPRDGMTNCLTNCRHKIVVRIPESVGSVFRRRMDLPRRQHMVNELKEIRRERSRARAMQIALGVPPAERRGSRNLRPPRETASATERARNPFRGTAITAPPPIVPFTRRGRRVRVTPTGFIQESLGEAAPRRPDPAKRAKKIVKVQQRERDKIAAANQRHQEKLAKIAQSTQDAMRKIATSESEQPTGPSSGDIVDAGAAGKQFEEMFVHALKLLGLSFETNRATGALWDIRPTGEGWHKLVQNREVNLKVHSTRWLFSDGATYNAAVKAHRMVKRGTLTPEQADSRVSNQLRKSLNAKGAGSTAFMKPRSQGVQNGIVSAAHAGDKDKLRELLTAKNFSTKRLGRFSITVDIDWNSDEWESTGYLRIDGGSGGQSMGATGRARKIGGVWTFAFRDRSATAKKPHHRARTENMDEREASFGIKRRDMPQIPGDRVPAFLMWLKSEHNISHKREMVRAGRLHPSQGEFNWNKVKAHAANRKSPPLHIQKPVLVSSDYYVLDGHHRWLEALIVDPNEPVSCIVINARIQRLIGLAHSFPGAGERRDVTPTGESVSDAEDALADPGLAQAVKRAGFDNVDQARDAVRVAQARKRVKKLSKRVRHKLVGPPGARNGIGLELLNDEWPRLAPIAEAVSSTWDSVPYSSMRIQDVARLFDGATRATTLNAETLLKIISRLIGALEFSMMSVVGRPEADRASKLIRGALDRLASRVTLRESEDQLAPAMARLVSLLEGRWRRADLDRKAKADPRFEPAWLDDDHYVANTYGWAEEPFVGAEIDSDFDFNGFVSKTDNRAMNGERVVDYGRGWMVVRVDWR